MPEPVVPEKTPAVPAESAPAQAQEPVKQVPQQEPPAEPAAPAPAQATEAPLAPQTPASEGPEPVGAEQPKVVQELLRTRRRAQEAERRAAYLEGQLASTAQPPKTQPEKPEQPTLPGIGKPPDMNDFPVYDDYLKESIKYDLRVEAEKKRLANEAEYKKAQQARVEREYNARVRKSLEKLPDYHEVIESAQVELQNIVLETIKESEMGPEVAYFLAKNPEEVERIAAIQSPSTAIREIGKIEARLLAATTPAETKPKRQVTQAPEPIKPAGGVSNPPKKSLEEVPIEDYMRQRNADTYSKVGNRMQPRR